MYYPFNVKWLLFIYCFIKYAQLPDVREVFTKHWLILKKSWVNLLQRKIFSFLLKISWGLPSMFIKLTNCLADTEVIVTDHLLLEFSDKGIKFCISSQFLWDSFLQYSFHYFWILGCQRMVWNSTRNVVFIALNI